MDKEQAIFEQITLGNIKKWSSTALIVLSQVWENFWKLKALLKYHKMLFHLKYPTRSHNIKIFVLNFLSYQKTA